MDQLHEELKGIYTFSFEKMLWFTIFFLQEPVIDAKEREDIMETNISDDDSELSESESYLTCDSGVSDDEGSSQSCSNETYHSGSRKRTRSSSDSEFSDALDR